MDLVAHAREPFGHLTRIVADAAHIRRVLAGDDVPGAHADVFPRALLLFIDTADRTARRDSADA